MQGALLKNAKNILVQQTINVQAARQLRFVNIEEILKSKPTIKANIKEAVELDKANIKFL